VQAINLYHGALLPKPEKFPIQYLAILLLLTVFVSGLWMYSSWNKMNTLIQQKEVLQTSQNHLELELESLLKQIPSASQEAQMKANIVQLQKQLVDSKSLSNIVRQLEQKHQMLYSGVLRDLSTLTSDDFWFTELQFNAQGIGLIGKTYSSTKIADLVTRLQLLPHTQNAQFGQLII